ncbi:hypothetical protein QQP08_007014 [Theobroma cacao]|nr:hypothetical protein QQP08_007014 [Theobroma cacao]
MVMPYGHVPIPKRAPAPFKLKMSHIKKKSAFDYKRLNLIAIICIIDTNSLSRRDRPLRYLPEATKLKNMYTEHNITEDSIAEKDSKIVFNLAICTKNENENQKYQNCPNVAMPNPRIPTTTHMDPKRKENPSR